MEALSSATCVYSAGGCGREPADSSVRPGRAAFIWIKRKEPGSRRPNGADKMSRSNRQSDLVGADLVARVLGVDSALPAY